jgi:hypothetical protein
LLCASFKNLFLVEVKKDPGAPAPAAAKSGGVPAPVAQGDYSHFNNKLEITDFDLLKVSGHLFAKGFFS